MTHPRSLAHAPFGWAPFDDKPCCPEGQRYIVFVALGFSPARRLSACRRLVAQPLLAVQGCSHLNRTGRSACATEEMTHPHAGSLRLGSLRLRSGQAGQAREDGAPVRALSGTAEDGRIAAGLL